MKRIYFLILFLFTGLLTALPLTFAHAQQPPQNVPQPPCVIALGNTPYGCASSADIATLNQAIGKMSTAITQTITQTLMNPLFNQQTEYKEFENQQKTNEKYEKETIDAAHRNQDAALAAIANYTPSQADCVNATAKIVRNYGISTNLQRAVTLTSADMAMLQNGSTGGQYAAVSNVAKNIQTAKQNATTTDPNQLANQPDKAIVEKQCANSDCYNQWVDQQLKNTLNTSAGDKAPWNAQLNPAMANYFVQRAQWEDTRSAARETVTKLLPKLYKRLDYYTQVQNDYVTSGVAADASSAQTRLNLEYPNSSKLGLSYYEMQEAEFNALIAGGQTILHVADNDSQRQRSAETLQADAAALQVAKMERDQLEVALKQLAVSPPPVSASALSINGAASH